MKKSFRIAGVIALGLLLSACNKLTQFSVSEQEVNQYLQKHNNFQKQIGIPGLVDADITVSQLSSQIGRAEPNKVTLTGNAKVNISSILGPQNSDMTLTLKAQPVYNRDEGAIYLKDMELIDYKVTPEKMSTVMKAIAPYLDQSLKSFFDQQPVYTLDPNKNEKEALAKKLAKGLEVKPGELVIPLAE
ncbi:lipoprotein [Enterobacillus tribolii]|uniref:Uncharacterized protein DUF1439 n=1 Tax=Enterobacillus tribolii TaxID=1487935 RepID=A0A370R4P5_9GAMM|nr:lipoprotein [Enterobacillus tribolii]MBW7983341.1 lipoprotein [Enterobacillus tribolii]RDK97399.1 uncharacterized protein DUF1439 [Enterobacillus tribolii]